MAKDLASSVMPINVAYGVKALPPAYLALRGAHLTLEEDKRIRTWPRKWEQVLETSKLVLKETQKCYMKLVHAMKCKVKYEIGQKVVMNVKNFTKHEGFTQKFSSPSL